MIRIAGLAVVAAIALAGCDKAPADAPAAQPKIEVVSENMKRLRTMDEELRLISLKRAIYDAGATCKRAVASGYSGRYKNMDQWAIRCDDKREWALFVGADDSVQLRLCADVAKVGLPACKFDGAVPGGDTAAATGKAS